MNILQIRQKPLLLAKTSSYGTLMYSELHANPYYSAIEWFNSDLSLFRVGVNDEGGTPIATSSTGLQEKIAGEVFLI
jgi:hypothetical protein